MFIRGFNFFKKPRRFRRWLIGIAVLLVIGCISFCPIAGVIIGRALHNAVETRLHARLEYDSLTYRFPYRVTLKNLRLVTDKTLGTEELLSMEKLDLQLARIPVPRHPVVIKSLLLEQPTLHLVRHAEGIVGKDLRRPAEDQRANPPARPLSDMFELRKFQMTGAKLVYEDRTVPSAAPLVFQGMGVDLGVNPESKSLYSYQMKTGQPPLVSANAEGTFDIDSFLLDVKKLGLTVQSTQLGSDSPLPPRLQQVVNELHILGKIQIDSALRISLRDPSDQTLSGDVSVVNASADLPRDQGRIDQLNATLHVELNHGEGEVTLRQFSAQSAAARLTIQPAVAQVTRQRWDLKTFAGQLDARTPAPTTEPARIAKMDLLGGSIPFSGSASGEFGAKPTYAATAQVKDLSILPRGMELPITGLNGQVAVAPDAIEFQQMQFDILSGHATAHATVKPGSPPQYQCEVQADSLDLEQLTAMPMLKGKLSNLSGKADLNVRMLGPFSPRPREFFDQMSADGDCDLAGVKLQESKLLTSIADRTGIARDSLSLGDAAAIFSIANRTLTLQHAAINSRVLGLQGKGTITFDGVCDLNVIAAPLGDWRKQIEKTSIPIISDVAGAIAGKIQKMVSATSRLLYDFQVTGKIPDLSIKAVPAPALTNGAANVYGKMLQEVKQSDLLKSLKEMGQ